MMANATDNQHAGQELRRDKRFQVSQAAIITQPGYTEIACEIRDFCQGGLFLKFTNPDAAIAALAKRADAAVEIVFIPVSINTTQTFRVPAQLKRLSPLGVGVAFVRQPVDALRALQRLRMAGHRQKLAALPGLHGASPSARSQHHPAERNPATGPRPDHAHPGRQAECGRRASLRHRRTQRAAERRARIRQPRAGDTDPLRARRARRPEAGPPGADPGHPRHPGRRTWRWSTNSTSRTGSPPRAKPTSWRSSSANSFQTSSRA